MSRVVFIENRGKTAFWAEVALAMQARGHEIGWIVQNPVFAPPASAGARFFLGFPKAADLSDAPVPEAVSTDRGRQYFGAGSRHYSWYSKRIDAALDALAPDVVIGEPTLMHELLTIAACRERAIAYLHPTMTRYPGGRFMILEGDTQIPFAGSGERWQNDRLEELASAISQGRRLPSYMAKVSGKSAWHRKLLRAQGQGRVAIGRMTGERFNTPSPARKLALQRELKRNLAQWNGLARLPAPNEGPVILYPLQMQPEANIDVWGRPYSDQLALVRRLLHALPADGKVALKANPKSKYEVSKEIIEAARHNDRLILLPLDCSMDRAQSLSTGAVTVSGTVGFEAVFGRGRCLSLRHPVLQNDFPEFHAANPEEAVQRLLANPKDGCGNVSRGIDLLARLVADSFPGTINEATYDPACLSSGNIENVVQALGHALGFASRELNA